MKRHWHDSDVMYICIFIYIYIYKCKVRQGMVGQSKAAQRSDRTPPSKGGHDRACVASPVASTGHPITKLTNQGVSGPSTTVGQYAPAQCQCQHQHRPAPASPSQSWLLGNASTGTEPSSSSGRNAVPFTYPHLFAYSRIHVFTSIHGHIHIFTSIHW